MRAIVVSLLTFFVFSGFAAAKETGIERGPGVSLERFMDRGNGTVLDETTGLIWLKNADISGGRLPYQTAKKYIEEMNSGVRKNFGYTDWRLPTVNEMETIVDRSRLYPSLPDAHPFENVRNYYYWTFTGGTNIADYVWIIDMASGDVKLEYVSYCSWQHLWPVRGSMRVEDKMPEIVQKVNPAGPEELGEEILLAATVREIEEKIKEEERLLEAKKQLEEEKARLEKVKRNLERKISQESPPQPPGAPVIASASPNQINLSWDVAPESSKVAGYNVYRNGVFLKSVKGTSLSQTDLNPDTVYCYTITAHDEYGNESKQTHGVCQKTLTEPDNEPPAVPTNFVVKTNSPYQTDLSWDASSDDMGVRGYKIYQDGAFLKVVEGTSTSVTGLNPDTSYCYVVTAYDVSNNESLHSDEACVKTFYKDKRRPSVPPGVTISDHGDRIDLSWGNSVDDVGITGYNIYQDGVFMKAVASNSAFSLKVGKGEAHCYTITAADASGNESRRSQQVCISRKERDLYVKRTEISERGTVWAGGLNKYGQLGHGSTASKFTLVMVEGLKGIVKIAAAVEHTVALKSDGTVLSWGRNNKGQLGDGTTRDRHTPVQVEGLEDVVDIKVGKSHTVALKSDGTVWTWGRNYYGQLGDGTFANRYTPVQVKVLKDVIDIAAGWYHTVALKSDGTVWTWGWNRNGQLGNGSTSDSNRPTEVMGFSDVEVVAAGMYHTVALKSDGTVWAWGWNKYGQLGDGTNMDVLFPIQAKGLSDVEAVSAGMSHTVALKMDGTVWAWGRNDYGQIGSSTGTKFFKPVLVEGIDNVKEIAAGVHHTVVLRTDGTVWAWGWRLTKKIGKDATPVQISGLTGIVDIAAGKRYTVAIRGAR